MTNVEALKKLYVSLGGSAETVANVSTNEGMIDAISALSVGIELPSVTSADNGDVLTVVDGAWNKTTPSSGLPTVSVLDNGKVLVVLNGEWSAGYPNIYATISGSSATLTGVETLGDLRSIVLQGKVDLSVGSAKYYVDDFANINSQPHLIYKRASYENNKITVSYIEFTNSTTGTVTTYEYAQA